VVVHAGIAKAVIIFNLGSPLRAEEGGGPARGSAWLARLDGALPLVPPLAPGRPAPSLLPQTAGGIPAVRLFDVTGRLQASP